MKSGERIVQMLALDGILHALTNTGRIFQHVDANPHGMRREWVWREVDTDLTNGEKAGAVTKAKAR